MGGNFITEQITKELGVKNWQVENTVELFEEGATIPFISRYRKEKTGELDEIKVKQVSERLEYYKELQKRKETVLKTIIELGKITPDLQKEIEDCTEKQKLEDLYLPYKPKKRTKAQIAREKGLEPLADFIIEQSKTNESKETILNKYVDVEKGVKTAQEALKGAQDIIAESIADNAEIRGYLRNLTFNTGLLVSKVKKEWEGKKSKFENYYDFNEPIKKIPSHRFLAIKRGAKENVLSYKITLDDERALEYIDSKVIKQYKSLFYEDILDAIEDCFDRLIFPSIETEVINSKNEEAEKEAINVFSKNLKNLLLSPPAGHKMIMGVDPGFRTGCKVAIIDKNGNFKEYEAIFPHEPQKNVAQAERTVLRFIKEYDIELISIGNGTASKESSQFINNVLKKNNIENIKSIVVNEAGASVYSASDVAIEEFPDLDVTVRGAISIARRLQDPLAELVKIDPKSIGVGQYQHDVNQSDLKKSLDLSVESAVNFVGVELNTASAQLLSHVSGIGKAIAKNIVEYRAQNGSFKQRKEIIKVPKLGNKAFEQCAGFLRIRESENPLDNSGIHPESYKIVQKMAKDLKTDVKNLIGNVELIEGISLKEYITEEIGLPTLQDIVKELKKPGLDPREDFKSVEFSNDINEIKDLIEGMELDGSITNVTNFGAFVDIGVHQDGLIHISNMGKTYIKSPHEIVSAGDSVKVKVLTVDKELKRIGLELLKK
ncbi:MAG: Tex family protein [bacterium]